MTNTVRWFCESGGLGACHATVTGDFLNAVALLVMLAAFGLGLAVFK